jgi:hypothetical protein
MDGRKHIFSDLKPYVCLFAECDLRMFADPYTWFDHELQEHRVEWCCQFCNHPPYHSLERFNSYMHAHHGQKFTETQLPTVAKLCQQPIETIAASDCPFCEVWETGLRVMNPQVLKEDLLVVTPSNFDAMLVPTWNNSHFCTITPVGGRG